MKILCIIPARSGSKGLSNKNIRLLGGNPMIYYSIKIAQKIVKNEDICVSTDSTTIAKIAIKYGVDVPFLRPQELSTDIATTESVILHSLNWYLEKGKSFDVVILLQPTSPLRQEFHIKESLSEFNLDLDMVVSVKIPKSNPYFTIFEEDENSFLIQSKKGNFSRRQDCPKVYEYNGAIYIINVKSLLSKGYQNFNKIKKYIMSEEYSVDIDNEYDFENAERLLKNISNNRNNNSNLNINEN